MTHAAWSLPGCGPVHVVHVENSAVAVDTSLPVWSDRHGRRIEHASEALHWEEPVRGVQLVLADQQKHPHKLISKSKGVLFME